MIKDQLQSILDEQNLTIYGACQVIGAELPDDSIKTIHKRLTRYLNGPPESIRLLEQDINAMGYEIVLKPKQ